MKMKLQPAYHGETNTLDPWDITLWGREVLSLLREKNLAVNFVNTDYEPTIEAYGRVVNARVRGNLKAKRKNHNSDVKVQKLKGSTTPVELDQFWHTSFVVDDWGSTRTFGGLVDEFLEPAAFAISGGINASILGQGPKFIDRRFGELGGVTATNVQSYFAGFNGVMNEGQDWGGAPLFIGNSTRTAGISADIFAKVNESGSSATLRKAQLGEIYNMNPYKTADVPGNPNRALTNTTTTTAAAIPGATTIALTSVTGVDAGDRIAVAGKPYRVASVASLVVTLTSPLLEPVANGATVKAFGQTTVDGAKSAGHAEEIYLDAAVVKGDVIDIVDGASAGFTTYTIIDIDGTEVWLDRPLAQDIADGAVVSLWPGGNYNFGFSKNAMLMVARGLPVVPPGLGSRSTMVNYGGLPLRITLSYEPRGQQTLVTLDMLGGLKPVMLNEGGILLA